MGNQTAVFDRDLMEMVKYRRAIREIMTDPRVDQITKLLSIQEAWTQLLDWFMKDGRAIPFPVHINSWSTTGGFLNQMTQESRLNRTSTHAMIQIALPSVDHPDTGYTEFVWMITPVTTRKEMASRGLGPET